MSFETYHDALAWLESHIDFERVAPNRQDVPSLQPIHDFLRALADPHRDYPSVHLTGTNGKGTTTTLTSALLAASGLRVGTFTSPDLHSVNERIAVAGAAITDEDFQSLFGRLRDVEAATGIVLTRFELLTVGGLLYFSDEGVDVAVVEVGLGGTWDSTNVIDSDVAVLTNVDLDHTAVLGSTVAAIASDKVGIFRREAIALIGTENATVVEIATTRARELATTLWRFGHEVVLESNDLAVGGRVITVRTPYARYDDVGLSLHGIHQGVNAACAIGAAEAFLGRALGEDVVRETLTHASMPGRLEVLARNPMIVVDGAHNPAGVQALANTLSGAFHVDGEKHLLMGMLTGRDVDDMVRPLLANEFTTVTVCTPTSPRALPAAEVAAAWRREGILATVIDDPVAALAHVRQQSRADDVIVVAGSLYLVADVRGALLSIPSRHI